MKHLVFGDTHCHPKHNNNRARWLGKLILDTRPDVVIDLGDTADMPSLSSYDKGKRSFVGNSYAADIQAHNEFQDILWSTVRRSKRKLPRRVRLIGNHEQRIDRALDLSPELVGTIGYSSLDLNKYYDDIVYYTGQTPGIIELDGVSYSHYFVSGVMGRPISGDRIASSLLSKRFSSSTQGHVHTLDSCVRNIEGRTLQGLVAGCFMDYDAEWAGQMSSLWWKGCFLKSNVDKGRYDLEMISMERLKYEYDR